MPYPQPNDPRARGERATLNTETGNRSNLFTVDKADNVVHRTSGPSITRTESYPNLHSEVLKSLIAIVKKYPKDGNDRVPALLELVGSIPLSQRVTLYARLSKPGSTDAFALYLRNNFKATREIFLKALSGEQQPEQQIKQVAEPSPREKNAEFVSRFYVDVQSDQMYIDNFTNNIMDAWLPNDRAFYFEYPGDVALLISLE